MVFVDYRYNSQAQFRDFGAKLERKQVELETVV